MGLESFYFPLDDNMNGKKTEYLMCRVERDLFLQLKQKAQAEGISFSDVIRQGCQMMLK